MDASTRWDAEATVVQLPPAGEGGEPQLKLEGTLAEAVQALRSLGQQQLSRCRISLPNAHAQPRRFEGESLLELLRSAPKFSDNDGRPDQPPRDPRTVNRLRSRARGSTGRMLADRTQSHRFVG
jgi:hypothetical protein